MTGDQFYERLVNFLQKELPLVAKAIQEEQSLPEQIRLERIKSMMKELLDHAQLARKFKGKGNDS